jgi:hypothetical protein
MQRPGGWVIWRWVCTAVFASALSVAASSSIPPASLGSLTSPFARAQDKPRPAGDIEPAEILGKNFAAVGLAAAPPVQTLEVDGQFGPPAGHALGDFHFCYKSPGSYVAELNFIGHGEIAAGRSSDGRGIFRKSENGVVAVEGVTIFAVADAWQMLVQPHAVDDYRDVDVVGVEELNKAWAYLIRMTPKKGESQLSYYDSDTFLLERVELVQRIRDEKDGPDKVYRILVDYNDYQASDKVQMPRQWGFSAGKSEIDFHVQSVRVNEPIDDAKFAAGR